MDTEHIVRAIMKATGWSQEELATAVGASQSTVNRWLGGAEPKVKLQRKLDALYEEHVVAAAPSRNRSAQRDRSSIALSGSVREVDATAGAGGGGLGELIVQHQSGYTVTADAVRDTWQIPDSYLRGELRAEASTTWIVEVRGDSGYDPVTPYAPGSVHSGDRVIIDTRDRNPSPPGPFAVFDGVGLVLKLVEIVPQTDPVRLRLSSRNPGYSPYEVTSEEAHIIGRVVGRISRM